VEENVKVNTKSTDQKLPVVTEKQTGQKSLGSKDTKKGHLVKKSAKVNTKSIDQKHPVVTETQTGQKSPV
jgi:hypothetical protein